ncbi:MAG: CAAX prenyl protease-related protein [Verrucomicrobiota bacterium]
MSGLKEKVFRSPTLLRVVPFVIFLILTSLQGQFGEGSRYWLYAAKTILGAAMIWAVGPRITEMRWKISWEGVLVGIAMFAVWVGLDNFYPHFEKSVAVWNPHQHFGQGSAVAWIFICVRLLGSTLVVPPLEEVFYRSFLYRYLIRSDFEKVPLGEFRWSAFIISSLIFGVVHPQQWLAGILCGLAFQALVCRHKRLGDAMTAHATTNLFLGLWVFWKDAWQFW